MSGFTRDRYDRPMIPPPDGGKPVPYRRISKFAGVTDDTYNLMLWHQRTTALGLAREPRLANEVLELDAAIADALNDPDGKRTLQKIVDAAHLAGGGLAAAERGSHLHILTEYVDRDEPLPERTEYMETSPRDRELMAEYKRATRAAGLVPVAIELDVVNDKYRVAGSLDRLWRLRDGRVVVGDYKSGTHDANYPSKVSAQERTYATSKRIDHETGERSPLDPDLDPTTGLLIHQPDRGDGTCTIYLLDLEAADPLLEAGARVLEARSIPKKSFIAPFVASYQGEE